MRSAQTYIEIVQDRGQRNLPLQRVYRNLQNQEFFFSHSNTGIMPSCGVVAPEDLSPLQKSIRVTPETADSPLAVLGNDKTFALCAKLRS
jgi:hypothetical protein